jgi:2-beta-glucuronyltransferase
MKVVFVTHHSADSDRKTGLHFWAELLSAQGTKVDWITVGFSDLTALKKDPRSCRGPYNEWTPISPNLRKFVWKPLFHPANFNSNVVNMLAWPIFSLYPQLMPSNLKDGLRDADLFIVECGVATTLTPKFAEMCPNAKIIYDVSDRYSVTPYHPMIPHASKKFLSCYDMIRIKSSDMFTDFAEDPRVVYLPQALDKNLFDAALENPYKAQRNAVSVGDMQFDTVAIETLAEQFPDWQFHLFGRKSRITKDLPNVITYGERPFNDIVPYIKFADVGIAPYAHSDVSDYLSESSLKLVQYTYCKLPIVTPKFASKGRDHAIGYNSQNVKATIGEAFGKAIAYDRNSIDTSSVLDWQEMLDRMMTVMDKKRV